MQNQSQSQNFQNQGQQSPNQGGFSNQGQSQGQQQQNARPIDKGRVVVVVERYPTGQPDQQGNRQMKNRYATVGRATLWPNKQNSNMPNIEFELDTIPLGAASPLKLYTFWDSESQNQN